MRITSIIPAYNCGLSIASVVRASLLYCNCVIVIDDASTDDTTSKAEKAGATVKRLAENKGKANAMRQGIDLALLTGFDSLVTIDADGEHDPSDIPLLTEPIAKQRCSVVFGVRDKTHGSGITANKKPTQYLLNSYFNINLQDAMCGYRAYSYHAISRLRQYLRVNGFGVDFELAVLTVFLGLKYKEILISTTDLKEYGGILASHFDGLVENFTRFTDHHTYETSADVNWLIRVNARDNFVIPIGNRKIEFAYHADDGFYYRR